MLNGFLLFAKNKCTAKLVEVKSAKRKLYFSLTHHYEKSQTVFFMN
jgi:hypothetical protein